MTSGSLFLNWINSSDPKDSKVRAKLLTCCGSDVWINRLFARRPYSSLEKLYESAASEWRGLSWNEKLVAYSHHPRIGERISSLQSRWSSQEQSGVNAATPEVIAALAQGNVDYETKFGFLFLICATGLSAQAMLDALQERLTHSLEQEKQISSSEHEKIIQIRIEKLMGEFQ